MKQLALSLFVLLVVAWWVPAHAQDDDDSGQTPVILNEDQGTYPLGLYMEILEDPGGELTIEDVTSPEFASRFTPSQVEVPRYGFTDSAFWVRFDLRNETERSSGWLLEAGRPNMQFVDLYTPIPGEEAYAHQKTGALVPPDDRDIGHPRLILDLEIAPDSRQSSYVRFQSGTTMALPLTLWASDAFWAHAQLDQALLGLYFGALLALLAYNLFSFLSLRELTYLFLVLLLASLVAWESGYTNVTDIYIVPGAYHLKQQFQALSFSLLFISMLLFTDTFLELKTFLPRLHRLTIAIVAVWGVLLVVSQFVSYRLAASLLVPWTLPSLAVILTAGTMLWLRGLREARLFMFAWAGLLITLVFTILLRLGVLPGAVALGENLYRAGIVWMAICWSFAQADRISTLKTETEGARRRLSQILEGLPIGVAVYGKDQRPTYINQRTSEILTNPGLGIAPDLSEERTLAQAVDYFSFRVAGTDQPYPLEQIPVARALQGESSSIDDLEADLVDKRVPLEVWGSPVKDDTGNVESAVVAFQDITQRKQMDAELDAYRQHLEQLVDERTTELRAVEQLLRTQIGWLSAFKEASQKIVGMDELPEAYQLLSQHMLRLLDARSVSIIFRGESEQIETLCHYVGDDSLYEFRRTPAPYENDLPLKDEIERGDLFTISADQLSKLPAPLRAWFQDLGSEHVMLAPMITREGPAGLLALAMTRPIEDIKADLFDLIENMAFDLASLTEDAHLLDQSRTLAVIEERNHLARELHDSVTQTLFTASVLAEAIPLLWDKNPQVARSDSERISVLLRGALAEMRSLLLELRDDGLYDQSLGQLLTTLAEIGQSRSRVTITVSVPDDVELPKDVSLAFYRIAREAMNNVINHSEATEIDFSLIREADRVELQIQDNGIGFDPQEIPGGHIGINIMTERAMQISGDLQINSAPGAGTAVVASWWDVKEA